MSLSRFDDLWLRAVGTALDELSPQLGTSPSQVRTMVELLRHQSFPASLALLGARGNDADVGEVLLRAIAARAEGDGDLAGHGINAAAAEDILRAIWIEKRDPRALPDQQLLVRLTEAAVRELAARNVPLRPEEAQRALELLSSGEFFRDLAGTTAVVLRVLPRLPIVLMKDVGKSPRKVVPLLRAVARDIAGTPLQALSVIADLRDGTLDSPPALMIHTLTWLYGMASARAVATMIRNLLAPENESLRLALVLYARANGVPLEPKHLDLLRETVFNTDRPDLGPLLTEGLAELNARYGRDGLETMLRRMAW